VHKLDKYNLIIFDCDGVILNSNKLKSEAFYQTTVGWGENFANQFVHYHMNNGGVSRYLKFEYFFKEILKTNIDDQIMDRALMEYAEFVSQGLMNCEIASGLIQLRKNYPSSEWAVASGGKQDELREVFFRRDIDKLFNAGIYGSPETKESIVRRLLDERKYENTSVLMLGDSLYDYQVALQNNIDFVFVYGWTEFTSGISYFKNLGVDTVKHISELN
jgi:phosphoglycolate phosphatase-like HAD superfamily hydrolase